MRRDNAMQIICTGVLTIDAAAQVVVNAPVAEVNAETSVTVTSPEVTIAASVQVTLDTPLVEVSGQIQAAGDITDNSAGTGSTMAGMRGTYNGHNHPGDSGGTTGTPNQQM